MNYPTWLPTGVDGGSLIALIAVLHVYIAHLAVGGGIFLVITEMLAVRWNNPRLLDYVRRHTWFFLLVTMVFGGVTGVGIWFIIALVQPAATSKLIHEFVFGWATEWVFFIVEIAALLFYHYLFGKLKNKPHIIIGWIYAAAAWASLFIINGILSFMLTPGRWLETGGFWDGFFNPGFFPSLVLRTAMALTVAGLFGLVTALREPDGAFRALLTRYCAIWISLPFVLFVISGWWYRSVVFNVVGKDILDHLPRVTGNMELFLWLSIVLIAGAIVMLIRWPRPLGALLTAVLVVLGLGWFGAFEYARENARRPYVIYGYMYSNSVLAAEADRLQEDGWLRDTKWKVDIATPDPTPDDGAYMFRHQCGICHSVDGHMDIVERTAQFDVFGMISQLTGQGKVNTYMPPFFGTEQEKRALAEFIVYGLNGKEPPADTPLAIPRVDADVPVLDVTAEEYALLAWNDLGMHCMSDADDLWLFLPPANSLWAQLIKRGDPPEVVTDGVILEYEVEPAHAHPEEQVEFWDWVDELFGAELEPGFGLAGKRVTGQLDPAENIVAYHAELIPVVPYNDQGSFRPYPRFTITARDIASGQVLATTSVVAPTSTEVGCKNCHGGGWRIEDRAGFTRETSLNILAAHDRLSGTSLVAEAEAGQPHKCQDCHPDPVLGAEGLPELLNLPAAIHGFHANYLPYTDGTSCVACHPSRADGATLCLRGRHRETTDCTTCHGSIADHALALLKYEDEAGKPGAARLMRYLEPVYIDSVEAINPRLPWLQEPDCLGCHQEYRFQDVAAFNNWTPGGEMLYRNLTDRRGIMCAACHNSPHSIYPAFNIYNEHLDNYQPLMYQGIAGTIGTEANCYVCHLTVPTYSGHHLHMLAAEDNPQPDG